MGARVAAYIAAAAPPLVSKLILEDPEWSDKYLKSPEEERIAKADNLRNRIRAWNAHTPQQMILDFRRSQSVNWHRTEYTTWADAKTQVSPNAVGVCMAGPRPFA